MAYFGKLYKRGLDVVRRSRLLTYWIFGVRVHDKVIRFNWDVTTLVLKKAIDLHVQDGGRDVLEMGCGHLALLAQYAKRSKPHNRVVGVDIYEEFARNAAENTRLNDVPVAISHSDLYAGVTDRFDYVFFNPPYVPTRNVTIDYPLTTFSGPDGTDTIRRFLADSHAHLKPGGRILLGVNCFHVPEQRVADISRESGYVVESIVRRRLNTARVFVLGKNTQKGKENSHGDAV